MPTENSTARDRFLTAVASTIAAELTSAAERRWGPERARELPETIRSTAETLALVSAVDLGFDDAEPDFIQ